MFVRTKTLGLFLVLGQDRELDDVSMVFTLSKSDAMTRYGAQISTVN